MKKLFAIISLASALCVKAGLLKHTSSPISLKKHGRPLVSLFTYGFDWMRDLLFSDSVQALEKLARFLFPPTQKTPLFSPS